MLSSFKKEAFSVLAWDLESQGQLKKSAVFPARAVKTMESALYPENNKLVYQYGLGFLISEIVFTASELGVFDLLLESGGLPAQVTIAELLGTSHVGMERLLEACVGLKLLQVERKDGEALYGNTDISNLHLAKSSPKSLYPMMMFYSEVSFINVRYLTDTVRKGKNQIKKLFDSSSKDLFEGLYRSEEDIKRFLNAMNSNWGLNGKEVMCVFDLSCFSLMCDVGGGGCALAKECISLYLNTTVTIYDLPEVIETAEKYFVFSEEHQIKFHRDEYALFIFRVYLVRINISNKKYWFDIEYSIVYY